MEWIENNPLLMLAVVAGLVELVKDYQKNKKIEWPALAAFFFGLTLIGPWYLGVQLDAGRPLTLLVVMNSIFVGLGGGLSATGVYNVATGQRVTKP